MVAATTLFNNRQQQLPRLQRQCRLKTVRPSCQRFDQRWMVHIGIRTQMWSKPTLLLGCKNRFPGRTLHSHSKVRFGRHPHSNHQCRCRCHPPREYHGCCMRFRRRLQSSLFRQCRCRCHPPGQCHGCCIRFGRRLHSRGGCRCRCHPPGQCHGCCRFG